MTQRAEVTYAVYSAENPASRPKIRKTPMRSWLPSVVRWRLMASLARVIAVEKPMQYSVPCTSLSIVLGIAISGIPALTRTCEYDSVSSPPMVTRTSMPSAARLSRTSGVRSKTPSDTACRARSAASIHGGIPASGIFRGFVRDVCRMVPPVRSMVRVLIRSSGRR